MMRYDACPTSSGKLVVRYKKCYVAMSTLWNKTKLQALFYYYEAIITSEGP